VEPPADPGQHSLVPQHLPEKLSEDLSRGFFRTVDKIAVEDLPPEVLETMVDALIAAEKRDNAPSSFPPSAGSYGLRSTPTAQLTFLQGRKDFTQNIRNIEIAMEATILRRPKSVCY